MECAPYDTEKRRGDGPLQQHEILVVARYSRPHEFLVASTFCTCPPEIAKTGFKRLISGFLGVCGTA